MQAADIRLIAFNRGISSSPQSTIKIFTYMLVGRMVWTDEPMRIDRLCSCCHIQVHTIIRWHWLIYTTYKHSYTRDICLDCSNEVIMAARRLDKDIVQILLLIPQIGITDAHAHIHGYVLALVAADAIQCMAKCTSAIHNLYRQYEVSC